MGNGKELSRQARLASVGGLGLATLAGATGVAGSELVRRRALAPKHPGPPPGPRVVVLEVDDDALVLKQPRGTPRDLDSALTLGLEGNSGYGQLLGVPESAGAAVRRRYVHASGARPARGDALLIDVSAFRSPDEAVGIAAESLDVETECGTIPAVHVPGTRDEWVILVHGRIAVPYREPLRMLRPVVRGGHPALIVSYRNAAGAPRAPRGISRFGLDEWADISAAIELARSRGARKVILGGLSMGGGIAMATAKRHAPSTDIAGLMLDSPVLDLWRTIRAGAARNLPGGPLVHCGLLGFAKPITRMRFGIAWKSLDHTHDVDSLSAPTLLIHGSADRISPVAASDDLAAARPDLVTYRRMPGVDHVRSWNASPSDYEEAVTSFLRQVAA